MNRALVREAKGALKASLPSSAWRFLKRRLARQVRTISLDELDAEVASADAAFNRSNDEGLAVLRSFELAVDVDLPDDPWSAPYRAAQLELFARISGRGTYSLDHERSHINLEAAVREPYPYLTHSLVDVGDQLIAIGYLIKSLGVKPPARIVEFGPGWGNTTCALAQMGFPVTAVDVDPDFLELIRRRLGPSSDRVELVRSDMLAFRSESKFDAAVFFESFHHCLDPLQMLSNLHELISADGRVLFASEPIDDFAMPWGVRLDGQSVWSMRKHGWLELGFETSFFFEALRRAGWSATRQRSQAISPLTDVIIARR